MKMSLAKWLSAALLAGVLGATLLFIWPRSGASADAGKHEHIALDYIGSEQCIRCHAEAGKAWRESQHALSMQVADEQTVLGPFDGKLQRHGRSWTRYLRRDGKFWVASETAAGNPGEFEVTHTFGVAPLQQYLVSLPDGRKQAMGLAWDSRQPSEGGQGWFHLFPGDGTRPGNPQHWAGIDQNWNYQCADCHSTNLRKNYDASADRFATTWSEISIGCEACHGPGSRHAEWAGKPEASRDRLANYGLSAALDERKGISWAVQQGTGSAKRSSPRAGNQEIEVCARCHARRGQLTDAHRAGDPFFDGYRPALLEPGLYHVDGQQREEVYNYASFLQSRMHGAGVTCADCHEPHGGKLRAEGNQICAQCHEPARFDAEAHHHHGAGSAGAQCVACHMPTTTYMGIDARHDHSLRIPRPDRSLSLGVPNACSNCHAKQTTRWADEAVKRWWPQAKPGFQGFAEAFAAAERDEAGAVDGLLDVIRSASQSPIARASALVRLPGAPTQKSLPVIADALADPDQQVRYAAVRAMAAAEPVTRAHYLAPLLADARRVVRIEAARALAGPAEAYLPADRRDAMGAALGEFIAAEQFNADRPEAQVRLGDLYTQRGDAAAAEQAYRLALQRDPSFVPAWVNLAERLHMNGQGADAVTLLRDALKRNSGSGELEYALGLTLVRTGERKAALASLASASRLVPDNARFAYVYAVAQHDAGEREAALKTLETARKKRPNDRDVLFALANYRREAGQLDQAADAANRLRRLEPDNAGYTRLAAELAMRVPAR